MIQVIYAWKILTNEGRLIEPPEAGAYYDEISLNNYESSKYGFSSSEEARETLGKFMKHAGYFDTDDLTLVKFERWVD